MHRTALRVLLIAIVAISLLGVAAFVIRLNNPWSRLESTDEAIDICSGRIRSTSYKFFLKTSERIEDSVLTGCLLPTDLKADPNWHRVNTFAPGVHHSPHYRFHSAMHQIGQLESFWSLLSESQNTPEVRRATARHVLALWQISQDDELVDDYLNELFNFAFNKPSEPWMEKLTALEMPAYAGHGERVVQSYCFPDGAPLLETTGYFKPNGEFVAHGVFAQWRGDGALALYGHHEHGKLHGVRFEWTGEGLVSGTQFQHGKFSRWLTSDFASHPDYPAALDLRNAGKE